LNTEGNTSSAVPASKEGHRYYIIAGEASGDLHGSNLVKAMLRLEPSANIRCWGGDKMEQAGATLVKHYRELAFMGFVEVIKHLPTILNNIKFCKQDISDFKPDILILIDYPGFNMRIAEWAKKEGIKIVYYISPQVWAWKEARVKKIKRDVDKMLVILPFEEEFYQKWDYKVAFVGHPLIQVISEENEKPIYSLSNKPIISILPGSRKQEIQTKLPIMLRLVKHFPSYQFIIAQAPSMPAEVYKEIIQKENVLLAEGQTYNLLRQSKAALVTSGTATLETALFGTPEVVCYKGNALSFWLAKKLVKVKYISLVNLIMDKEVVKELIQDDLNETKLREELDKLLNNQEYLAELKRNYDQLWHKLGDQNASMTAAKEILSLVS
jgi:lipid-A-disaccharide synthase